MELKNLTSFVLLIVLVGMLIGIGIIVSDKFSAISYYTRDNYNDTITISNFTTQNLDYGNITNVDAVWNGTSSLLPGDCYDLNETQGNFVYYNDSLACNVNGTVNFFAIYDFREYNTATRGAMASASAEIGGIATNWLSLIVTIAIMAIVLGLVIKSFSGGYSRK